MNRTLARMLSVAMTASPLLIGGCLAGLDGPPPAQASSPPPGYIPPGQVRRQEVHERNEERRAEHQAEKAERRAEHRDEKAEHREEKAERRDEKAERKADHNNECAGRGESEDEMLAHLQDPFIPDRRAFESGKDVYRQLGKLEITDTAPDAVNQ